MKSNTKKRLIAFMLCMVLVLSSATSAFADEPQNTDSQSQAEVVTEPVADEATGNEATGNEATGDEATEDEAAVNSSEQQQQEEQQPETESTPEGNLEDDISIQTTINGTTITMSGPYSSFPEGSNYEILASELNEEETKNVEVALKKKEDEINTKIATYKAYDIKLLVDGIESQPTGNVNVKFEGGEVQENLETAENIEVYHVDETTQIANDIEKTAVDDTVTMTTNHFSTYVITTTQPDGVDITVQHYIKYTDSNNHLVEKALYRDSKIHLNKNQVITDLSSLQNYTSQEVIKIEADGSKGEQISNDQVIIADQTYRVYYTPTTATSNEAVQMFDYQVKGEKNTSINAEKNYDPRSTKTTRFASGLANNQYSGNGYDTTIEINNQNFHINTWDTNSENTQVNQYNNTAFGSSNVGFGEPYPALTNAEVTAKKSPTTVDKTVADDDHVVAIGDIVTYTIEAYVPFLDAANTENRTFTITDKIKGAEYYLAGPNAVNSVTMEGKDGQVGKIVVNEDGKGFTVNLNTLVADTDNPNAGKKITVTYTAKVTKTTVENKAGSHAAGVDYGADNVPVKLFTGELVLLKYGDGNVNNALANAEFVLYKDGEEVPLTFTKQENGKYKYAPDAEDATATLVTDENGMIDVEGLDVGSYHFEETKAPEGYSINTDGKTLTLTVNGDVATAKLYNEGQLNDTKLSALPSTGGIGTTIFTIAGCLIMIAAAGLFFASRKKSDNK